MLLHLGPSSSRLAFGTLQRRPLQLLTRRTKSVLVTGGGMGLGEAICRRLAADGYAVTIADIDSERGAVVAQELGGTFLQVDVSQFQQVQDAVHRVVRDHGTLDALVNNAGVVGTQVPYADYDVDEWKRIIDINLNGTFFGLKYGTAQMRLQDTGGAIVNLCSTAGFRGLPNLGPYTAAKFAVRGMTQAAAVEVADRKIRINAIAPTTCDTPMVRGFIAGAPDPRAMEAAVIVSNAIPAMPQLEDVAAACAFLLSDQARFITGHTLPVDAGALSKM